MTLPASGPISFSQLQTEFGGTNPIGLDEYYSGGVNIPASGTGIGIPASGALSMNMFYGKTDIVPGNSGILTSGSSYTLPLSAGPSINVFVISGGGGGGGGSNRRTNAGYQSGGGGGGGGTAPYVLNIPVTPGQAVTFSIGGGGGGGALRDGIYSSGSNGSRGGSTIFYVNGVQKAHATGGYGGLNSPNRTAGTSGEVQLGQAQIGASNGLSAGLNTSTGGSGARGFFLNTTVGLPRSSIISTGAFGTAGGPGSGVPCVSGTGYGGGGTGGGTAQGDAQNNRNAQASAGLAGAIFIWWGY
jgi:hypothetical protein